jgi:hypothetical protein
MEYQDRIDRVAKESRNADTPWKRRQPTPTRG